VNRLRAGRPGFNSRRWQWRDFLPSPSHSDWLWGQPSLLSNGYRGALTQGGKADHSVPSIAEVKNSCRSTSTPQYILKAWCACLSTGSLPLTLHRTLYTSSHAMSVFKTWQWTLVFSFMLLTPELPISSLCNFLYTRVTIFLLDQNEFKMSKSFLEYF
jgi:hypothetical protein